MLILIFIANTIKQNITDLSKMIMNSRRLTDDNLRLLEQAREELNKLLSQQIKNIEQGFADLLRRLEEKKYEIVVEFENKYKREDQRLITIQNNLDRNKEEIGNIEKIFMELIEFVDQSSDAQILLKVSDVTSFLHKSFTDLENITKFQLHEKNEIYIQPSFRPLYLNTAKTLELVKRFEMIVQKILIILYQMIAPAADQFNAFELKFLKQPSPDQIKSLDNPDSYGALPFGGTNQLMTQKQVRENFSLSQLGQKSASKRQMPVSYNKNIKQFYFFNSTLKIINKLKNIQQQQVISWQRLVQKILFQTINRMLYNQKANFISPNGFIIHSNQINYLMYLFNYKSINQYNLLQSNSRFETATIEDQQPFERQISQESQTNSDQSKASLNRRGKQGQQRRTIIRDEMQMPLPQSNSQQNLTRNSMNQPLRLQKGEMDSSIIGRNSTATPQSSQQAALNQVQQYQSMNNQYSHSNFNQQNGLLTQAPQRKAQATPGTAKNKAYDAFDQISGKPQTNLKLGMQKLFDDSINDVIYMYGPKTDVYMFKIGQGEWEMKQLEKSSDYQGGLKNFSLCNLGNQRTFMTGGVLIANNTPSSNVYEFNLANMFQSIKKKPMNQKRYGHGSIALKSQVYVLGGYGHKDQPGEPPQTLASCEKFNQTSNNWENISGMNQARVFFGFCSIDEQYIYTFGGIHDYQFLSNIEKYDVITDTWISLYFKLPSPLAKLSAIAHDKKNILVFGGMTADYEPQTSVYNLDVNSAKFIKKASMRNERLKPQNTGAFFSKDQHIYALNGCYSDFTCERFNIVANRWEYIPSYQLVSNHKPINDYIGIIKN